jgi:hypothetical protein
MTNILNFRTSLDGEGTRGDTLRRLLSAASPVAIDEGISQASPVATPAVAIGPNPGQHPVKTYLPLEWLLQPRKAFSSGEPRVPLDEAEPRVIFDRILARLTQAEAHELDVWLREDYRQAFITVALTAKNFPNPFLEASIRMNGCHPDKVFQHITNNRKAQLGGEYSRFYDENGVWRVEPLVPKKGAHSAPGERRRKVPA